MTLIYKIIDNETGECYIGSTKHPLSMRLSQHKYYKRNNMYYSSSKLNLDNCCISAIEECNEQNRYEREAYWIKEIECVNDRQMGNNFDEKQYRKQYNELHKEKIKEYHKKYRIDNKEKIKETQKKYNELHKEKIKEKKKQYRTDNKDYFSQYKKQYHQEHKDEISKNRKQYYLENRERLLEQKKEYNKNHKKEKAEYDKIRRDWIKTFGETKRDITNLLYIKMDVFH